MSAVATFYTMYKRKPTGEYLVSVCTNTLCGMLGGDEIYRTLSELLGVGMNETAGDPDTPGSITLEHAECLAACDYAPVVTVNYEFFDNQTSESAVGLVEELRAGNRPLPSRGAPLCSFKEISRQIAGFVDSRPEARTATGTGGPTEVGVRLAQQRDEAPPAYGRTRPRTARPRTARPRTARPSTARPARPIVRLGRACRTGRRGQHRCGHPDQRARCAVDDLSQRFGDRQPSGAAERGGLRCP